MCSRSETNNDLFELRVIEDTALSSIENNQWKLWHQRLGHLGKENMKKLTAEETNLKDMNSKMSSAKDTLLASQRNSLIKCLNINIATNM